MKNIQELLDMGWKYNGAAGFSRLIVNTGYARYTAIANEEEIYFLVENILLGGKIDTGIKKTVDEALKSLDRYDKSTGDFASVVIRHFKLKIDWRDFMQNKLNNGGNLRVVLFVSRNKDNTNLDGFEQRKETFVSSREVDSPRMQSDFERFVQAGLPGEMSRMYVSVNRRDNSKVVREMQHYLLENPNTPVAQLTSKLASLAAQKQNAAESKWLFDYDADKANLDRFLDDLLECGLDKSEVRVHPTPNGAAVVVDHGFDTRQLLDKWEDVELKRDDMLLVKWETKKA